MYKIPFNKPSIVEKELFYISQAIHNGYSAGDAGFTQKCHALLESILNVPLHLSPMGQKFGYKEGDLPNTESISDRLLRLPFYNEMTEADQTQVIEAIKAFRV